MTPTHVCPACGSPITFCVECKKKMVGARADALTCSGACRIARYRRLHKEEPKKKFAPGKNRPYGSRSKNPQPERVVEQWDPK